VKGIEADLSYRPEFANGLTLSAAANYNRARYTKFPNAPCGNGQTIAEGCNQLFNPTTGRFTSQDLGGRPLVRAPDWSLYGAFDYQMPIGHGWTLALGADVSYSSSYYTALITAPDFLQHAFAKYDANLAVKSDDGRWEFALSGRNLGNKIVGSVCTNSNGQNGSILGGQINGAVAGGPAGRDETVCAVQQGREIWARISLGF
jgi:iron complex outermembrane receptor protein